MSLTAASVITVLAAYLLGSIPTGFLVAKAQGIDIRAVGSGNIGATNALRTLGKPAGAFVLLVDVLKGWFAVWAMTGMASGWPVSGDSAAGLREVVSVLAGLAVVVGHDYTCWLRFKGGKGIATTAGVLLALAPWVLVIVLGVWLVCFVITRYVSVASLGAAVVLPLAAWFATQRPLLAGVAAVMGGLALVKHKANLQRLRHGTEPRFGEKKQPQPDSPAA